MKSRISFVFIFIVFSFAILLSRAAYLQLFTNNKIESLKKRQFETVIKVRSQRGSILDRKGQELAASYTAYSLYANPHHISDPYGTAKKLSRTTKMSFQKIYKKIKNKRKYFVWLQRQLSKEKKNKIKKLNLKGLYFIEEPKRIYPNERLLSQVIGFVSREGKGLEGLEYKYDKELRGPERKIRQLRDAKGRPLLLNGYFLTKELRGSHLHLTIDSEIQFKLERELEKATVEHKALSAMGVILDAQTSEILAMVNVPGYDLNKPLKFSSKNRRNRIVTDNFEPGSTLKTFIVATALAQKLVKPNTKINCYNGKFYIGKRVIREAGLKSYKFLTVNEVLRFSSNIGATQIAFLLGDKAVRAALENFGFSQATGVDLPGEGKGILQSLPWSPHLLSNISFGHGIGATALQVANAYAAIANGGILNKPRIVKAVETDLGHKAKNSHSERRVLSPEVSELMRLMLMSSAPKSAYINGFPVAGKTGTAQKVDFEKGGYKKGSFISSFAGFVPAHQPKFIIYIAIDEPKKEHYGSQVAAPVFSKVASYAVRKAGLPPVFLSEENILKRKPLLTRLEIQKEALNKIEEIAIIKDYKKTPELLGLTLREVYQRLQGTSLKIFVKGHGVVVQSFPRAGTKVPKNKTIRLVLK